MCMRRFKKRTLALMLASVVTVVGSFASENYKNSVMSLSFENKTNGSVNMVVETRAQYNGDLPLLKKDVNTYILTLPEVNSDVSAPNLEPVMSNIASVNVRTMPYSSTAKGYTRITIKTKNPSLSLTATPKLYVESDIDKYTSIEDKSAVEEETIRKPEVIQGSIPVENKQSVEEIEKNEQVSEEPVVNEEVKEPVIEVQPETIKTIKTNTSKESFDTEFLYLFLWALVIVFCAWFFYIKARDKMQEISGESLNLDVEDDEQKEKKQKKEKKVKKIAKTINKLDSTYSQRNPKTLNVPVVENITAKKSEEEIDDFNVVDLDELFKEQKGKSSEEEENEALEDFLSGFSFNEFEEDIVEEVVEEAIEENVEDESFDEEYYEKIISNKTLHFSADDVTCINKLLGLEVNDDTLRNLDKYLTNPIQKPSKKAILENLVTTYAISQDIRFTSEDISTLNKLINVELDQDFITDLSTNPARLAEYERQMQNFDKEVKKSSNIITLSVKDMLPNLTEELQKQGGKDIECEYKPETVYFSKGYDVNILSVNQSMPDLTIEINNEQAYMSKPSAEYAIVDNSYVVGDSVIENVSSLPDLKDVLANPEKYAEPEKEEVVADEEKLLQNILNVTFKPFYEEEPTETKEENLDNKVENIFSEEVVFVEEKIQEPQETSFETEKEPVKEEIKETLIEKQEVVFVEPEKTYNKDVEKRVNIPRPVNKSATEDLMRKIEATKQEREQRRLKLLQEKPQNIQKENTETKSAESAKRIFDGETYSVLSTVEFEKGRGCYLSKNEKGYVVFAYSGDKVIKLKEYDSLKSEKIQARLNEELPDGTNRYLIRIGLQKFIVDVSSDSINYVMDLC